MAFVIPKVNKCCFCLPFYPSVLTYGYFRLIITILMSVAYMSLYIKYQMLINKTPILIPFVVIFILTIDVLTIIFILYGYYKNINWKHLHKHFSCIVYSLPLKGIVVLIISFFPYSMIVIPYSVLLIFDAYIIILIGTKMIQIEQSEGYCGFANKNFENDVKIEVVEDTIPDIYKNKVYLVSDDFNPEVIVKNGVSQENTENKNKHGQAMESVGKVETLPTVTYF